MTQAYVDDGFLPSASSLLLLGVDVKHELLSSTVGVDTDSLPLFLLPPKCFGGFL